MSHRLFARRLVLRSRAFRPKIYLSGTCTLLTESATPLGLKSCFVNVAAHGHAASEPGASPHPAADPAHTAAIYACSG